MKFLFIFLSLPTFLWGQLFFEPPKPRALIGYRVTPSLNPHIWVEIAESFDNFFSASVMFNVRGADRMMVSNYDDFRGAKWLPYKEKVLWQLRQDKEIVTVYAVFSKRNPDSGLVEISPIVHYTIDKRDFSRVLERTDSGYIDWTRGALLIEKEKEGKVSFNGRQSFHRLRDRLERESQRDLFLSASDIVMDLRISPTYTVREKLLLENIRPDFLFPVLNSVKLVDSLVDTSDKEPGMLVAKATAFLSFTKPNESVRESAVRESAGNVNGNGSLAGANAKDCLYRYFDNRWVEPDTGTDSQDGFFSLVIDLRGFRYPPSMFPSIENERSQPVLNGSLYKNCAVPFVRFTRSLKQMALPKKTMLAKAYDIRLKDFTIILSQRYWRSLLSSKDHLQRIANGNFWILVD